MTKPIDEKDLENVQGGDGEVCIVPNEIRTELPARPRSTSAVNSISIPPDTNPDD